MKSQALTLLFILIFLSIHQNCFAQQKGVDDLVAQYQSLLHPSSDEAKNSLSYTQHYMDLRKKVAALGEANKTAFETAIAKFSSDTGYNALHNLLFAQEPVDTLQNKNAPNSGNTNAGAANPIAMDTTVQMQVFDKKHKLLQTTQIKPADIETRMKKDGFQIAIASYDFNSHTVTLTLSRTDASGTTARITMPATGDIDAKYKLQSGQSLSVHSGADGTSSVQVIKAGKTSQKKK